VVTAAVALATVFATTSSAWAGKPPGGGGHKGSGGGTGSGGTIGLVVLNSPDGLPHWGEMVTFNISTTATDQPWVNLLCYQNGTLVSNGWNGFFDGSLTTRNFGLYSPKWTGGPADCTANLTNPQWAVLASTGFHVYA
jgi:hypothetical protein